MNDMKISMEYKYYMEHECGYFNRNSSVAPFSVFIYFFLFSYLFLWPRWLFLFISHLSSLGSFNLSSFGIFYFVLFGIFSSLKGNTLYFTRIYKIFTLYKKYSR